VDKGQLSSVSVALYITRTFLQKRQSEENSQAQAFDPDGLWGTKAMAAP
jgi:hypothetical protein